MVYVTARARDFSASSLGSPAASSGHSISRNSPGVSAGGFVDVAPICSIAPPPDVADVAAVSKRMRESMKSDQKQRRKSDQKQRGRPADDIGSGGEPMPVAPKVVHGEESCKAIVVYQPPPPVLLKEEWKKGKRSMDEKAGFEEECKRGKDPMDEKAGSSKTRRDDIGERFGRDDRPFCVRDCPPGMRIMSSRRTTAVNKTTGVKRAPPICTKGENSRENAIILSDSDSDEDNSEHLCPTAPGLKVPKSRAVKKPRTAGGGLAEYSEVQVDKKVWEDARMNVRNILEKFDALRRRFLRDEERRVKEAGRGSKRPDLRASNIIMTKGLRVNGSQSIIGIVPGVEVGDSFNYRMEMCIISLHRQSQGGIDYVTGPNNVYGKHVAVSVIASGGYEDDVDTGETLIYTGQGGNNYKGNKRQAEDQQLLRGNLALKNSRDENIPVRVIRGCADVATSPSGKVYYYDGLYKVVETRSEVGASGHVVFKFELKRLAGQAPLSSSSVMFQGKLRSPVAVWENQAILKDISKGLESVPVAVTNTVDEDKRLPDAFNYIVKVKYPPGFQKPPPPQGCGCKSGCFEKCPCIKKNRGHNPYNQSGSLVRARKLVYECADQCCCGNGGGGKCYNRVSQKGVKFRLEVFKSEDRGWGVRSWDFIPSGSFICEYLGELVKAEVADRRENDEYLFDLEVPKSQKRRWGDVSDLLDGLDSSPTRGEEDEEDDNEDGVRWTLDAREYGSVARFINHSCSPNLFVQCVLYDHDDLRLPHIMLFAQENIPPRKELTYDYAYGIDEVKDAFGNVKIKKCLCGSTECTGRLY